MLKKPSTSFVIFFTTKIRFTVHIEMMMFNIHDFHEVAYLDEIDVRECYMTLLQLIVKSATGQEKNDRNQHNI